MTEVHPSPDGKPQICATKSPSSRTNLAGIHDTTEGEISWPNRLLQEPYFHSGVSRRPAVIDLALLTAIGGFSTIGWLEWQTRKGTRPRLFLRRQKSACPVPRGQYLLGPPPMLRTGHTAGGVGDDTSE